VKRGRPILERLRWREFGIVKMADGPRVCRGCPPYTYYPTFLSGLWHRFSCRCRKLMGFAGAQPILHSVHGRFREKVRPRGF
jgi:hypothetical protein